MWVCSRGDIGTLTSRFMIVSEWVYAFVINLGFFFFFFFQAEDGIRDGRGTGVQTCALPISPASQLAALPKHDDKHGAVAAVVSALSSPAMASPAPPVAASAPPPALHTIGIGPVPRRKIGRASCRERGEVPGGGGGLKQKPRE